MWQRWIPAALVFVIFAMASAYTQPAIDCDAAAPPSQVIRTGQPYTTQFCVASVVTVTYADGTIGEVPNRIDGYKAKVDAGPETELGKLPLGPPSATLKLQAASFRSAAGVPKGDHTVTIRPWNYPLNADGTPNTSGQPQYGEPVSIPFSVGDPLLEGAPPPIQKGRVIR
jgi:hypothetical protein